MKPTQQNENMKVPQIVINVGVLLIMIPAILYVSSQAEKFQDYNSQLLRGLSEIKDAYQSLQNAPQQTSNKNNYQSEISKIVSSLPMDFIAKDYEKTIGIQALLKIYQLGYRANLCDFKSLELRARGVSSFGDVLSILMSKDPNNELLQTLQLKLFEKKYSMKNPNLYLASQLREFFVFVWGHRSANKLDDNQSLMDMVSNFEKTMNSITFQKYTGKFKIIYMGDLNQKDHKESSGTTSGEIAQTYLTKRFSEPYIVFEDIIMNEENKVNKLKNLQLYIRKHCKNQEDIILLMNSGDRLISPFSLSLINSEYLKGALMTTSKQIYSKELSVVSEHRTNNYKALVAKIEKASKGNQKNTTNLTNQYTFTNLKTFSMEVFNYFPIEKLVLQIPIKKDKAGKKIEEKTLTSLDDSISSDPDLYDHWFIYPLVQISGKHYHFIPEIMYEKNSYKLAKELILTEVQKQRQQNILDAIENSVRIGSEEIQVIE